MSLPLSGAVFLPHDQWKRNQLVVTCAAGFIFAGFTMILPFVPLYIQMLGVKSQAATAVWAGVVLGVTPLTASVAAPFWGRVADRFGLKLMAIRISFALFVIWALTGFAKSVLHLFLLRFLLGLFGGFNAFSISLATQLSPKDKMGKVIGTLQAVQVSSAAIGPFIGGILAGWIGIRHTFLATAFFCLLSLILFAFLYKDNPSGSAGREAEPTGRSGRFREMLSLPNFLVLALLLFLVTAIDRSFSPVIPLIVARMVATPLEAARTAGIVISLASFAESFAAWHSGRRISQVSPKHFLLLRLFVSAAVCFGLGFVAFVSHLVVLRVLLALVAGGIATIAYTLASRVIPEGRQASAFGLLSSCSMLGSATGPVLGGLSTSVNLSMIFVVDSLLYTTLGVIVWQALQGSKAASV